MTTEVPASHAERLHYRSDIDGLRAVAVLSVVMYHALPHRLPGGFVGVDVFFVISGFLITGLIDKHLTLGQFSFTDFYVRRVKRIFPALLLVLVATYGFGWWVLLADEFSQLGTHVAGGAGFAANLVLWHEAGYFDNASDTKPLLHLWSLGIEEQFYLLWPCLLWAANRRRWPLLPLVSTLALLSFACNLVGIERDAVATFYAAHTRCWELFAGALLACSLRDGQFPAQLRISSLSGLVLIGASLYLVDDTRAFPGIWALLPVMGTVLVIGAGPQAWPNRMLLSARPLVALGLISYPLYLWHWPLLSFARIVGGQAPSVAVRVGAVGIALALAWLTYVLIEVPLRYRLRGAAPATALVISMAAMGALGYATFAAQGLPARAMVVGNAANIASLNWDWLHTPNCDQVWGASMNFCLGFGNVEAPRVALLGDSTSNALAPGLGAKLAGDGHGLINVGSYFCPPVRGLVASPGRKYGLDCLAGTRRIIERVAAAPGIDLIVLALFARDLQEWGIPGIASDASDEQRFAAFKTLLAADIDYWNAAGKRVIVSYDMPYARIEARDCLPRPLAAWLADESDDCYARETSLRDRQPYLRLFDEFFSSRDDVCVFRQSELLIHEGRLRFADEHGQLLLRDDHHLSIHGSARMAELLVARCGGVPAAL